MVSNAAYTLQDLLDEATQKLKSTYKNAGGLDPATLSIVWGHTCIFIEEQLVKGKAVLIPGLGSFTHIHKKTEIGNKGVKSTRTPVFVVADAFCSNYDVKKDANANLTTSVPTLTLNYSLIASLSETNRDVVMDFHKEAIKGIGGAIRNNRSISVELKNIGNLVSSGSSLKATFNSDLVAQMQVFVNSPNKGGTAQLLDIENEPANIITKSSLSASLSPPSKKANFSASVSRGATPRDDYAREKSTAGGKSAIILPQVDRPKNPLIKLRANSDSALRPLSAFNDSHAMRKTDGERGEKARNESQEDEEYEEEWGCDEGEDDSCDTCEHCILKETNLRNAQLKRAQERAAEDAAVRAQKSALQALDEKEQMALKLQKAMRADADLHNKAAMGQKQENTVKQKKADYYGDIFYARRPDTPEHVKKANYKSGLEDQIMDNQSKHKQKQVDSRKEHEVFHETQKQADERARKLKQEDKQKQREYADQLMHQMAQKKTNPALQNDKSEKFERSTRNGFEFSSTTANEDLFRPSTAELKSKRRSFDAKASDHHTETLHQRRQKEAEDRAAVVREQQEVARVNQELRQQQIQEDINKKMLTREILRNAWDNQTAHKRNQAISEMTENLKPHRTSLDLGTLAIEPKHKCRKCGRGYIQNSKNTTNFRRTSGDFRASMTELPTRKSILV